MSSKARIGQAEDPRWRQFLDKLGEPRAEDAEGTMKRMEWLREFAAAAGMAEEVKLCDRAIAKCAALLAEKGLKSGHPAEVE